MLNAVQEQDWEPEGRTVQVYFAVVQVVAGAIRRLAQEGQRALPVLLVERHPVEELARQQDAVVSALDVFQRGDDNQIDGLHLFTDGSLAPGSELPRRNPSSTPYPLPGESGRRAGAPRTRTRPYHFHPARFQSLGAIFTNPTHGFYPDGSIWNLAGRMRGGAEGLT